MPFRLRAAGIAQSVLRNGAQNLVPANTIGMRSRIRASMATKGGSAKSAAALSPSPPWNANERPLPRLDRIRAPCLWAMGLDDQPVHEGRQMVPVARRVACLSLRTEGQMSARATPQATMGVVEFKQYLGQLYRLDKDQVSKLLLHLRSLNHLTVAATSAPIGDHPSDDWLLPGLVD